MKLSKKGSKRTLKTERKGLRTKKKYKKKFQVNFFEKNLNELRTFYEKMSDEKFKS